MLNLLRKISTMLRLWKDRKQLKKIEESNLFDADYYLKQHHNLKQKPHIHYYYYGWKNLDAPSFSFSTKKYLERYEDVLKKNINPLIHYLEVGKKENRIIEFDEKAPTMKDWYQKKYQENYDYQIMYQDNPKRIQLFLEKTITDKLISFLNELIIEDSYEINIINYQGAKEDFKRIKGKISYCNLKENNYLECSLEDIFLTTSKKVVEALLHTKALDNKIFYYVEDNTNVERLSDLLMSQKIVILRNKEKLNLKKTKLEFQLTRKEIPTSGILYVDMDSLGMIGLDFLNEIFLRNILKAKKWQVYFKDKEIDFFQLDCHVLVKTTPHPINHVNFYWRDEKKEDETELIIKKKYEEYQKETIDITNKNSIKKLKKIEKDDKSDNTIFEQLEELWKEDRYHV